jgi:hypothetical protein
MLKDISPNFSLQGFSLIKFLKGNKEFIKTIIALGFGATGYLVTGGYLEAGLSSILSKFALDILDYYTAEVDNSKN